MHSNIQNQLDQLIGQWCTLHQDESPKVIMDTNFPSPCYLSNVDDGEPVAWQPVKQAQANDLFDRLEEALEFSIHPSIKVYYGAYWSDPLLMSAPEGDLTLLFAWSEPDLERLRGNLLGHVFSQMKRKQPISFFFACTIPDDSILSVRNEDGSVWLETTKKGATRKIADDLYSFLATLTPKKAE